MQYGNADLHNIAELYERAPGNCVFSRLPNELRLQLNPFAQEWAFGCGGAELRFNIESDAVTLKLRLVGGLGVIDVLQGTLQSMTLPVPLDCGPEGLELRIGKPDAARIDMLAARGDTHFHPGLTRILLPYNLHLLSLEIEGEISPPRADQTPRKKLLTYGSSITHGFSASRPSGTYAMRLAAHLGMDLINLGLAGSAHMEIELADHIAERCDWDCAVLEMGINIIGEWPVERFAERVNSFIGRLAESLGDRRLIVSDLFLCDRDLTGDERVKAYRSVVKQRVASLKTPGMTYVSGRELLTSVSGLTMDLVHPSPEGMEEIASNLARIIKG